MRLTLFAPDIFRVCRSPSSQCEQRMDFKNSCYRLLVDIMIPFEFHISVSTSNTKPAPKSYLYPQFQMPSLFPLVQGVEHCKTSLCCKLKHAKLSKISRRCQLQHLKHPKTSRHYNLHRLKRSKTTIIYSFWSVPSLANAGICSV